MQSSPFLDYDPELLDVEIMTVTEKRVHSIESELGQIAQRLAKLEGHREASSTHKPPNGILIAILSVLGIAVIWYWGWIGTHVVDQGRKIDAILLQLRAPNSPKTILDEISRLKGRAFSASLPALNVVVQQSPEAVKPSSPVLQAVAQKLLSTQNDNIPDYWPTVLRFIQFATAGLSPDVPPKGAQVSLFMKDNHLPPGSTSWPLISHQVILLDGGEVSDMHVDHSRVIFTQNPVKLTNVTFVDCVFEMPDVPQPSPYIQQISRTILSSNLESIALTTHS